MNKQVKERILAAIAVLKLEEDHITPESKVRLVLGLLNEAKELVAKKKK